MLYDSIVYDVMLCDIYIYIYVYIYIYIYTYIEREGDICYTHTGWTSRNAICFSSWTKMAHSNQLL